MYSYQHKYHAGNIADLHKHITLIAILQYLQQKTSPCYIVDAFAGDGLYNLSGIEAQKNQEYLYSCNILKKLSNDYKLFSKLSSMVVNNTYPGSPMIINKVMRSIDRANFIENHPQSYNQLIKNIPKAKNIKTFRQNAYELLYSLIRYKEPRGFFIFDPSYEIKSEYEQLGKLVEELYKIKSTCIYMIWYPILSENAHYKKLTNILNRINNQKIWHHTLMDPNKNTGMVGSGIFVLNMPWTVDKLLEDHFNAIYL